ncbi:rhomboid-like protein [Streptomyces sp. URMC 123]|uniref:rhomboid-like protein n=1 Tax=Streptomyces sp. URMC 123 TaxID=3423403 RepID=UPI003F1B7EC5
MTAGRTGPAGPTEAAGAGGRAPDPRLRPCPRPCPRTPRWRAAARWLPTPLGTPFTFCYLLVLAATTWYARHGDPDAVARWLERSSTDVEHLTRTPLTALVGSALWLANPLISPYSAGFVLVLTRMERLLGGLRAAAVFAIGHVTATLLTEVPVGVAVHLGHLPETSLRRLDYGISFGLMASIGALSGLLRPRTGRLLYGVTGLLLALDLFDLSDPMAAWGHPAALLTGLACRPLARRWARDRAGAAEAGATGTRATEGRAAS